jgi:uncharacterized protein with FMN-binding domain
MSFSDLFDGDTLSPSNYELLTCCNKPMAVRQPDRERRWMSAECLTCGCYASSSDLYYANASMKVSVQPCRQHRN